MSYKFTFYWSLITFLFFLPRLSLNASLRRQGVKKSIDYFADLESTFGNLSQKDKKKLLKTNGDTKKKITGCAALNNLQTFNFKLIELLSVNKSSVVYKNRRPANCSFPFFLKVSHLFQAMPFVSS